jgi:hypothetical protein
VLSGQGAQSDFGADVFRSPDGGATWTYAGSQVFADNPTLDLAYTPLGSPGGFLYTLFPIGLQCPEGGSLACLEYQVFSSRNRGRAWTLRGGFFHDAPTSTVPAGRLWTDPRHAATVYAAVATAEGASALVKSADGGISWTTLGVGMQVVDLAFDPGVPGTLYAAVAGLRRQVLRSADGGATWQRAWGGGLPRGVAVTALAFDRATPSTLYAGTAAGGVFATTNGGASWQPTPGAQAPLPVLSLASDGLGTVYAGFLGAGVFALSRPPGH